MCLLWKYSARLVGDSGVDVEMMAIITPSVLEELRDPSADVGGVEGHVHQRRQDLHPGTKGQKGELPRFLRHRRG